MRVELKHFFPNHGQQLGCETWPTPEPSIFIGVISQNCGASFMIPDKCAT